MIIDMTDCLRVTDNPLLHLSDRAVLVWIDQPHLAEGHRMSARRRRFMLQAVADLRKRCRALGGDLVVRAGERVQVLQGLSEELQMPIASARQTGWDERQENEQLIGLTEIDARTLYQIEDLPFGLDAVPEPFTAFRNKVQKKVPVAEPMSAPTRLAALPDGLDPGEMSAIPDVPDDARGVLPFEGGETAALQRLESYFADPQLAPNYKKTRNGLLGANYSTKFSPWLAQGSLSARVIWHRVNQFEREVKKNDSTYWIKFELLWREYFRWWVFGQGRGLFAAIKGSKQDPAGFQAWCDGNTGVPFIDANMRELNATGFMSNRGRQNVASFLTKDLGIDWRLGAEYFEQQLLDYDDASNWGNWAYVAGVGADPRDDRWFNVLLQATRYDGKARYVKHWCPEVADLDSHQAHWPWVSGSGPRPRVHPDGWYRVIS